MAARRGRGQREENRKAGGEGGEITENTRYKAKVGGQVRIQKQTTGIKQTKSVQISYRHIEGDTKNMTIRKLGLGRTLWVVSVRGGSGPEPRKEIVGRPQRKKKLCRG